MDDLTTAILPQLLTCVFQFIKTNSLVFHHFRTPKKQQFHLKQHRRSMKDNYLYIYIYRNWSRHVMFCREQFLRSSEHESIVKFKIIGKLQTSVFYHDISTSVLSSSEKSRGATSHGNILPELPLCNFCNMNINKIDCSTDKVDVRIFKKRSRSLKTRKPTTIKMTVSV